MATLFLIGTPIGNLEDVTLRALRTLSTLGALAVEDTRITPRLLDRHGIARPEIMFPSHVHNEDRAVTRILSLLAAGTDVGLVSDAGLPGLSDPGFLATRAAIDAGHRVEVIPGPSAATMALVASGLPTASFTFLGFPPRTSGKRRNWLSREAALPHSLVLYEAPTRLAALLDDALAVLGDRRAAVCLELTKLHERIVRGYLSELASDPDLKAPRGEITVVIAGDGPKWRRGHAPVAAEVTADGGDAPQRQRFAWRTFDALSTGELYAMLRLRSDVFIVEQASAFGDVDGLDPVALHLLAHVGDGLGGYLRVLPPGVKGDGARIGRVVTAPTQRGSGLGGRMMQAALAEIEARHGDTVIDLSAQSHLERFYGRFGFVRTSPDYVEDGILHCDMRREPPIESGSDPGDADQPPD